MFMFHNNNINVKIFIYPFTSLAESFLHPSIIYRFPNLTHTEKSTLTQTKEGEDPLQHHGSLQSPVEGYSHGGKINFHDFHKRRNPNHGAAVEAKRKSERRRSKVCSCHLSTSISYGPAYLKSLAKTLICQSISMQSDF